MKRVASREFCIFSSQFDPSQYRSFEDQVKNLAIAKQHDKLIPLLKENIPIYKELLQHFNLFDCFLQDALENASIENDGFNTVLNLSNEIAEQGLSPVWTTIVKAISTLKLNRCEETAQLIDHMKQSQQIDFLDVIKKRRNLAAVDNEDHLRECLDELLSMMQNISIQTNPSFDLLKKGKV